MSDTATSAVSVDVRDDGVAVIAIDVPGQPVNTLGPALNSGFDAAMERIEGDTRVRAAIIVSRKRGDFIAGADIKVLDSVASAADAEALSRSGQAGFQRIADARVPIVAAIHGSCLGGGLELALACHGRVATDEPQTKLGLPEVQLGLIPGAGGTQRLPRLIGLQAALDMILTGKRVPARKAKSMGLVDEVVPRPLLEQVATGLALRLAEQREAAAGESAPRRSTLGGAFERMAASVKQAVSGIKLGSDLQELVLEDNPLGRKVVFDTARKKLLATTHGNYPAPEKALEAVRIGISRPEDGYAAEARYFGELAVSPQARQLMGIFLATTALKKDTGVADADATPRPVHKVGVLGAGLMGAGISYVTAQAGIPVRIKDRDPESVGQGLASVRGILDGRVKRKRLSARRRDEIMALVSPTTDYSGFGSADVVIEAVFEDLELKRQMVRDVEAVGRADVIFASNTSTIPIGRIAEASSHPETVIGMHYFSPVHKMPLLEIIVTDATAPWVTATCVALGKRQGKTVIVVRDSVGFYTSRILGPYINEAMHVLTEGVPVEVIDDALVKFGFPVGPIKLLDEVGIDVAEKAGRVVRQELGERMEPAPGMEKLIQDQRLGRKNRRGFYLYGDKGDAGDKDDKKKRVDPSVYALLDIMPDTQMPAEDIARRCSLQMVNEAAHCFGEGVVRSARDGDIGAIFGLGFPPFLGGPFRYADSLGVRALVGMLREHATRHGRRFEPAPVLVEMAEKNLRFYPDGTSESGDAGDGQVMQPGRHPRASDR